MAELIVAMVSNSEADSNPKPHASQWLCFYHFSNIITILYLYYHAQ